MLEEIFGKLSLGQIIIAVSILVIFLGLAWLVRFVLVRFFRKLAKKSETKLDDAVLSAAQKPLFAIVILLGLYLAVLPFHNITDTWSYITRGLAIVLSLLGIYLVVALLNTLINWYQQEVCVKNKDVGFSLRLARFSWWVIVVIAAWVAVIASMGIWGFSVTPVTSWLGEHGWRIVLIVVLAVISILVTGEIVPRIIVHTLNRRPDETEDEVKKIVESKGNK